MLILTLISAVGRIYVKNKKDPFIARLMMAVEKRTILDDVRHMGMFIVIGDSKPEYEYNSGLRVSGSRLPRIPSTPYTLIQPK